MVISDLLNRLDGLRRSGDGWIAKCPAHEDQKPSLSVGIGKDRRILLHCQAGCSTEAITRALGLTVKDLFAERLPAQSGTSRQQKKEITAVYRYTTGAEKIRYDDKSFTWRQPDGKGGWQYTRKGLPHVLYVAGELSDVVAITEGEKDADNIHAALGIDAVSGEDGAGPKKWKQEYTEQLRGKVCYIIGDNDQVGKDYIAEVAGALHGVAAHVFVLDIVNIWPACPEHGDVSDLIQAVGKDQAAEALTEAMRGARPYEPKQDDPLFGCFKKLADVEEEEPRWFIEKRIPEGQISILGSDGGIGKTSICVNIAASRSSGTGCILDPPGFRCEPQKIAFISAEDSVRKVLKRRLRLAGANQENILVPDFAADKDGMLRKFKFGSEELARFIRYFRPDLAVFDPIQAFLPPKVNMGARNEMRDALDPLVSLGEETGCTFLILAHSNKRKGASGRDRLADSADLWDLSRSVLMAGWTGEQGIRYLSHEKSSYAFPSETLLFSVGEDGQVKAEGTTWKRDKEFMAEATESTTPAPKRDECKTWILETLAEAGGEMDVKALSEGAKMQGYQGVLRRAKDELKDAGSIRYVQRGQGKDKTWFIKRTAFEELSSGTEIPWDGELSED